MKFDSEIYENMYHLTLIREAFPDGYNDECYKYVGTRNDDTMVVSCQLVCKGKIYTVIRDPEDLYNIECSENFEEVAKDFSLHLMCKYFTPVSDDSLFDKSNTLYFSVNGSNWSLPSELEVLYNLVSLSASRSYIRGGSYD